MRWAHGVGEGVCVDKRWKLNDNAKSLSINDGMDETTESQIKICREWVL